MSQNRLKLFLTSKKCFIFSILASQILGIENLHGTSQENFLSYQTRTNHVSIDITPQEINPFEQGINFQSKETIIQDHGWDKYNLDNKKAIHEGDKMESELRKLEEGNEICCYICLETEINMEQIHTTSNCNHHACKHCAEEWRRKSNMCGFCRTKYLAKDFPGIVDPDTNKLIQVGNSDNVLISVTPSMEPSTRQTFIMKLFKSLKTIVNWCILLTLFIIFIPFLVVIAAPVILWMDFEEGYEPFWNLFDGI